MDSVSMEMGLGSSENSMAWLRDGGAGRREEVPLNLGVGNPFLTY